MDTNKPHEINKTLAKVFLEELAKYRWDEIFERSDENHAAFAHGFDYIINVDIEHQIMYLADDGDPDITIQLGNEDFEKAMRILRDPLLTYEEITKRIINGESE